jgi:uncharacterized repeat protein (TIGR01451 family)
MKRINISSFKTRVVFVALFLFVASIASAATLNVTTKYTKTGGIKGALNTVGDQVNGVSICPANPTAGCDFGDDPHYNNNGTVSDSSDDFYENDGDLVVRTNDVFEVNAAWSWSGIKDGPEEEVTIVGTLPATGEYAWTDVPGSCAAGSSSISADGLTITCVRNDFTTTNTHAEDLLFTVRVLGDAQNGATPGDISFEASSLNAQSVSDDTDNTSLTITAAPRWNIDKDVYTAYVGQSFDDDNDPATPEVNGYIINYIFYIESDEVDGETDDAPAALGNESMGDDATFNFVDHIDEVAPNAQLVGCNMNGRLPNQDGYIGSSRPITFNGAGSIYGEGVNSNRKIPQPKDEQQIECVQNGTDINVTVSHVNATLTNAPTHSYNGVELPVNRKIAAIGSINVFVPLSDVEAGPDGQTGTADDGELPSKNKIRNFDPTTPGGNSNFGGETESELDNDSTITLYGTRGSFDKYYRGDATGVWTYPGGQTPTPRAGNGLVTQGYEFSTVLANNNTGGTAYTENMCDVVDAYRLEIQDIEDNTIYNIIKTYYGSAYHDNTSPIMYNVWNGSGDYDNGQAQGPYEFEYSSTYEDNSWLPSRGGDQSVSHKTEIEAECNAATGWHATADAARADANGIGAVTKVRIKLRDGVEHIPGAYTYFWLNHKVRANDLLTGAPLQKGDEITNYAAHSFNGDDFTGSEYIPNQYPEATSGSAGDRVTFSGGKVRIEKSASTSNTSPGQEVEFTLASTYTNDTGTSETGRVIIRDIMPNDITYVAGSVIGAAEPAIGTCADVDASLACADNENQVLIWDLGDLNTQDSISNIIFKGKVSTTAAAGSVTNMSTISSPSDASAITQRRSSVGLNISVPSTLNIIKSTVDVGKRERTTVGEDIDYEIDLRNGKPGDLTELDVIDILPFAGDGANGAINFNNATTERDINTDYHGSNEFVSMNVRQHPDSVSVCDLTANGGVKYYYTDADPTTINLAPSVGAENDLGGANTIWKEGTATNPPAEIARGDITAVRIFGPNIEADGICQLQLKMHIQNNLADDVYSNSSGATAIGVTLPVMSNSEAVVIVGSTISNFVFKDLNANGIQDAGDEGIENVTVELLDGAGNPVNNPATGQPYIVQTNAQGEYLFEGLSHGDYQVRFTAPTDYQYSSADQGGDDSLDSDVADINAQIGTTNTIALGVDEDNDTVDAGMYKLVSIGDRVWLDANANGVQDNGEGSMENVQVKLLDEQGNPVDDPNNPGNPYVVTTDANGNYLFDNLMPGVYTVEVVPPAGYVIAPQNQGGDSTIDSDFSRATNRSQQITLNSGDHEVNVDAGLYQPVGLGDTVWNDVNGDGILNNGEIGVENVTVSLLDGAGNPVDNPANPGTPYVVQTDANGNYLFENIPTGDYQVEFTTLPANYVFSPQNQGGDEVSDSDANQTTSRSDVVTLGVGDTNLNVDAGIYLPASIGNFVWDDTNGDGVQDAGETGIEGVVVHLLDGNGNPVDNPMNPGTPYTVTTDTEGAYVFNNLPAGDYQVQFDLPAGYTPSLQNQGGDDALDSDINTTGRTETITVAAGENNTTVDAGLYRPVSLGNFVWQDNNANGIQEDGEPGLENVEVRLLDEQGNPVDNPNNPGNPYIVQTDADGSYIFNNLAPGNYIVDFVTPNDYAISPQNQGGAEENDSDADVTTHRTDVVTLNSGDANEDVDAGMYQAASIGNKVWRDDNRDGLQDDWEPGLEGVVVELLDGDGNPVDDPANPGTPYTITTGANGEYLFENLIPGDYQVKFTPPADHNPVDKDQGGDDTRDSDIDMTTLTTDTITLVSGEDNTTVDAGFYALYANVFDPPSAVKTVSDSGENEIEWKMVWINDGNMVAINTQILDDVPAGTTYVSNSVLCEARGLSTTSVCVYDSAENRIRWEGDIAPDPGGTTEDNSVNEVVITYRTTVPEDMETVENQAAANWDANGDGDFNDDITRGQAPTVTDDSNIHGADPTVWKRIKKEEGDGSIGDTIWLDLNSNGKQDKGEPGLENIRVKLLDDKGRVVARTDTNHNGHYIFENLPKGKYKVVVKKEDVAKYIQTYDPDSKMNGKDTVHLRNGQNYTKGDFGYINREFRLAKTGENSILWLLVMMGVVAGVSVVGKNLSLGK